MTEEMQAAADRLANRLDLTAELAHNEFCGGEFEECQNCKVDRDAVAAWRAAKERAGSVGTVDAVADRLRALADRMESGHARRTIYQQAEALSPRVGGDRDAA